MKVSNAWGVPNQFLIEEEGRGALGNFLTRKTFQSYESTIAVITHREDKTVIELDEYFWDYSTTTGKYRNKFLGENKKETQKRIDSGEYKLVNLNQ